MTVFSNGGSVGDGVGLNCMLHSGWLVISSTAAAVSLVGLYTVVIGVYGVRCHLTRWHASHARSHIATSWPPLCYPASVPSRTEHITPRFVDAARIVCAAGSM